MSTVKDFPIALCSLPNWRSVSTMAVLKNPSPIWIIHGYANPACYAAFVAKVFFGSKVILWGESNYQDHKRHAPLEWFKRTVLRMCDQVHVYGQSARDYCLRLGVPDSTAPRTLPVTSQHPTEQGARIR